MPNLNSGSDKPKRSTNGFWLSQYESSKIRSALRSAKACLMCHRVDSAQKEEAIRDVFSAEKMLACKAKKKHRTIQSNISKNHERQSHDA